MSAPENGGCPLRENDPQAVPMIDPDGQHRCPRCDVVLVAATEAKFGMACSGWRHPEQAAIDGEVCAFGWPEGCEYHLPDEYAGWCSPCRLRVVLRDVRLDEWVQEHRPEWCYRIDHLVGPERTTPASFSEHNTRETS